MTKNLLTCLLATAAVTGSASPAVPTAVRHLDKPMKAAQMKTQGLRHGDQLVSRKQLAKGVQFLTVKDAEGHLMKRIATASDIKQINPYIKAPAKKAAAEGCIMSEDFEAWDEKDITWLPEGFSHVSKSDREGAKGWFMGTDKKMSGYMEGLTGKAQYINFDVEFLDEWIVFPEVTLGEDMVLSFDTFNDGIWYFSTDNVDWETLQYVGDKVKINDQQVMISEDGGETWTELKSLAADFEEWDNFSDLLYEGTGATRNIKVPLAEYSGKTVKLAYRYVGNDGNLSVIDNIKIGYPAMEVNYSNPLGTLFFGMSPESYSLNYSVLAGPVFRPWYFMNNSYAEGATYSWSYMNADTEIVTSDETDLSVTYHTDYTNEFTTRNNWYIAPVLTGSAPGYSDGIFTRGRYLQAGGKGEFIATTADGEKLMLDLGLSVIDPATEGLTVIFDQLTPIFGYSGDVDNYWTRYTFGDEGDENNYVHYDGYMNFFYNLDAPIVIKGIRAQALAKLKDGARMKAEIVLLSDEGVPSEEALATAYCDYKDMTILEMEYSDENFVSLNFSFDEPIVMSSDVCMAYVVRISGFNDPEHVEYFNPVMSATDNPDGYALGWIEKSIVMDGADPRTSITPAVYYTNEQYLSFYIMLDAEFPWFEGPESVDMGENAMAEVVFDSSVAGEDLKFENLPEWLSAKAEGIHGDTKVTFFSTLTDDLKGSAKVTISAPGVSHDIIVNADGTGVAGIDADAASSEIFNLSGVRVSDMNAAGVYIVKDAKGNVRKVVKD